VTRSVWAALVVSIGLAVEVGGGLPVHAVHVSADVPLAISAEDVQRFQEAHEEMVVIDLRPPEAFQAGHVPHARSLPLPDLRRRAAEVPRAGRVVLYAGTPGEAAVAYQALREAGHRNVMVLAGGLPGWIRLGFPVEVVR
jgi:rhodanese-related sulfurtransferase